MLFLRSFSTESTMASFLRKILLVVLTVLLVKHTVDFSTPPFVPLKAELAVVSGQFATNPYYQEYIVPLQEKVCPVVSNLQEGYFGPALEFVYGTVSGQYKSFAEPHLQTAIKKITDLPFYSKHSQQMYAKLKTIVTLYKRYTQIAFEKSAIGVIGLNKLARVSYAQISINTKFIIARSSVALNEQIIPSLSQAQKFILENVAVAAEQAQKIVSTTVLKVNEIFEGTIRPQIQIHVYPKVTAFYDKYIKVYYTAHIDPYVQVLQGYIVKYYNLLRVNQILNLSKALLSSSFDQLKQVSKVQEEETSVVAESLVGDLSLSSKKTIAETGKTKTLDQNEAEVPEEPQLVAETAADEFTEEDDYELNLEILVKNEEETKELELNLADEIVSWEGFINETIANIFKNFERSIGQIETETLEELKPAITKRLQIFSAELHGNYGAVNKLIYNIDSHPAVLESGEPVELDKEGRIIDHKVSREEFRGILNDCKDFASRESNKIHEYLISQIKDLESKIDIERRMIVDIYEEFAEVAINEFSKKMMYSTFSNSFNKISKEGGTPDVETENFLDWKQYVKVKNSLIKKREDLISKKVELDALNRYIAEIQGTLKAFVHESGDYYALLRAQANIEFQNRESREKALENGEGTSTNTIIKRITKTLLDEDVPSAEPEYVVDVPAKKTVKIEEFEAEALKDMVPHIDVVDQFDKSNTDEEESEEGVTVSLPELTETEATAEEESVLVNESDIDSIQEFESEIEDKEPDIIEHEEDELETVAMEEQEKKNLATHEVDQFVIDEQNDVVQHLPDDE